MQHNAAETNGVDSEQTHELCCGWWSDSVDMAVWSGAIVWLHVVWQGEESRYCMAVREALSDGSMAGKLFGCMALYCIPVWQCIVWLYGSVLCDCMALYCMALWHYSVKSSGEWLYGREGFDVCTVGQCRGQPLKLHCY